MAIVGKIFDDNPVEVQETEVQETEVPVEETAPTGKNTKGGKK